MRAIGRDPIFIARGEGAELVDVDGNRFVDYVCSWGPLIHGHAHPQVLAAVDRGRGARDELRRADGRRGRAGGRGRRAHAERRDAAHDLLGHRGDDDARSASRARRPAASTVLKFAGAYHGHVDGLLAQAGSGLATQALPASPGVPAARRRDTVVVPWNDASARARRRERTSSRRSSPSRCPANMGLVPPRAGFLELLRERADATGALLVLDEVISGFRVARGGAQELHRRAAPT